MGSSQRGVKEVESDDSSESGRETGSEKREIPADLYIIAEDIFETLMVNLHQRADRETSHIESEDDIQDFDKVFKTLKNLEDNWGAAASGKPHEEVKKWELRNLHKIVEEIEKCVRSELRAVCYVSVLFNEVQELEVEPSEVRDYKEKNEDNKKRKVGEFISEASEEVESSIRDPRRKNKLIASEVNRMLDEEEERIRRELKDEKELLSKSEKFLTLLKGLENEIEAIYEAKEDESLDLLDQIHLDIRSSVGYTKVTLHERRDIVEEVEKAEGVKETISRVFYGSLLK